MSGPTETSGEITVMPRRQEIARVDETSTVLTPMDMLNQAVSQGANIDVLEKLMGLQERWEANQAKKAYDAAIAAAKAEIPSIIKNKTVDFTSQKGRTNYKHETLDEVVRTIQPFLSKHGLDARFRSETSGNMVTVICRISHKDGYAEETGIPAPADTSGSKNPIQAIGSTITYLQRYTLKLALGLAASDDDDARSVSSEGGGRPQLSDEATSRLRDELRDLIELTGASVSKLCKMAGVDSLSEIPADDLPAAINSVRTYGRNKGALQ